MSQARASLSWRAGLAALAAAARLAACNEGEIVDEADDDVNEIAADCPQQETTETGLIYEDVECGDGEEAVSGATVTVHYTGTLEDGTQVDSSHDRDEPFTFVLGAGMVIRGWDEGLQGMQEGGSRRLEIPPDLAYGEQGVPPTIPENATLIFEVELLEVQLTEG
jgi:FKBP-type peptidyl-prolyl cis-trans isomerase FkpA